MQTFQQVSGAMTNDRFKQEASLIALRALSDKNPALMAAAKKFLGCEPKRRLKLLAAFEECEASLIAALAEAMGEALVIKFGPDTTEEQP